MIAFYLALGHGVIGSAPGVADAMLVQVLLELSGQIAWSIVRQQPGPAPDPDSGDLGRGHGQIQDVLHVLSRHGAGQKPGDDIAAVVIHNGGQVVPAPAYDLEVGEVGLPKLMHPFGLVPKLVSGCEHNISWAGHQFLQLAVFLPQGPYLAAVSLALGVAHQAPLASVQKLLAPAVIQVGRDTLPAAQCGYAFLAPKALQDDADLLLSRILPPGLPAYLTDLALYSFTLTHGSLLWVSFLPGSLH